MVRGGTQTLRVSDHAPVWHYWSGKTKRCTLAILHTTQMVEPSYFSRGTPVRIVNMYLCAKRTAKEYWPALLR